jgi:riboflavin kinase / FMN adenylyltransferase
MLLDTGLDSLRCIPPGAAVTVGNFDGVHLGHASIVRQCVAARAAGREAVLVTFEPHPLTVLRPNLAPPRIASFNRKRQLLAALGVDRLVTLAPTPDVLGVSAEDFYAILRDEARVSHLVEGLNFNFGKARRGNIHVLREWCSRDGMPLTVASEVSVQLTDLAVVPVSSSLIRWLITHGRVRDAEACLGRPFSLDGKVVRGEQRGRTIGFPTANLQCDDSDQLLPAPGVYTARCHFDDQSVRAALSIGTKPTFEGSAIAIEAHLIDFSGDLYGKPMTIELLSWVRDQQKFHGIDALKAQLARDVEVVRS